MNSVRNGIRWSCVLVCTILLLACQPRLDEHQAGNFQSPIRLGIRNLTVVEIIPQGKLLSIDWKGYNTLGSTLLFGPHEIITVTDGRAVLEITDKPCGNNELAINGHIFHFNAASQRLQVTLDGKVTVCEGAGYDAVTHIYDKFSSSIPINQIIKHPAA